MRFCTELPAKPTPDEIIDVRSPAEFAADHIPGAINLPVLTDPQRATVGTLDRQQGSFEARKVGAALVCENIAHLLHTHFAGKPKRYSALIYCWRGGQRSHSLATLLDSIGFQVQLLKGGYKNYRRQVIDSIATIAPTLHLRVIHGLTGSGKTRLLHHLHHSGHQILDLEHLASHRSSLLGRDPTQPQPTQKAFESLLALALQNLDPTQPVYIEAESRKVGNISLPTPLWTHLTRSPVIELSLPTEHRVQHLISEYDHFLTSPQWRDHLRQRLDILRERCSHAVVDRWQQCIDAGQWQPLVHSLLTNHYDPLYRTSRYLPPLQKIPARDLSPTALDEVVSALHQLDWPPPLDLLTDLTQGGV